MLAEAYQDFFPHFNGGAFLIREGLCQKFKEYTTPSYAISHDTSVPIEVRHIGVQYGASFALMKISDNWKPFNPGFNYIIKAADIERFGKNNIKLLHYCGAGAYSLCRRYFGELLERYLSTDIDEK